MEIKYPTVCICSSRQADRADNQMFWLVPVLTAQHTFGMIKSRHVLIVNILNISYGENVFNIGKIRTHVVISQIIIEKH